MKRYKLLVLFVAMVCFEKAHTQTEPLYSQYMFNVLHVNPAYAGARGSTNVTAMFRNQWVGMKGAPKTSVLSGDLLTDEGRMGLGLQLLEDRLGAEKTTGALFSYSYRIPVNETGVLSLGIRAGAINYRVNYTELSTFQPGDPAFAQNVNGMLPAAGAGVYYTTDKFYVGLSAPSLLATKINGDQQKTINQQKLKNLHLFLMMGTVVDINDLFTVKPSLLVKRVNGAPVQFDVNVNLWMMERMAVGVSYRTKDAVVGMLEWQLNDKLRLGYAYDYNISSLRYYNQGSHELMIRYEIPSKTSTYKSNRYF